MKITRRSTYLIASGKGPVTTTKPDEPGERNWFANQQYKRVSLQERLNPEKAIEPLINR